MPNSAYLYTSSAYITPKQFMRSPTGLETTSLVGNSGFLSGPHPQGIMTLTLYQPLETQLQKYDLVTLFDGANSEQVQVNTQAIIGSVSIQLSTGTNYAHVDGTEYCTDGTMGSLAEQILKASQAIETFCRQTLFPATYTNELLALPTMRASIDNYYGLHFRPRHWPVQTLTAISIAVDPGNFIVYDPAQVFIESDKQICTMPNMQVLPAAGSGQTPYSFWNVPSRTRNAQITISYTGGYTTIPNDVVEAATLLTSDILAKRNNPIGATDVSSGGRHISAVLRGDNSGQSLLFKRAKFILDNYDVDAF